MSALRELATSCRPRRRRTRTGAASQRPRATRRVLAALRALAPDLRIKLDRAEDARSAIAVLERERWSEIVPPVVIGWDGALVVPFAVPAELDGDWEVEVTTEAGGLVPRARAAVRPARATRTRGRAASSTASGARRSTSRASSAITACAGGPRAGRARRSAIVGADAGVGRAGRGPASGGACSRRSTGSRRRRPDRPATSRTLAPAVRRGRAPRRPLRRDAADPRGVPRRAVHVSPYSPASRLYWNELYLDLGALAAEVGHGGRRPRRRSSPARRSTTARSTGGAGTRSIRSRRALLADPARAAGDRRVGARAAAPTTTPRSARSASTTARAGAPGRRRGATACR